MVSLEGPFQSCLLLAQPTEYLNKLPAAFAADDRILVSDPMMATGGTMVSCLELRV